ncbi:hypothetical protein Clocl_0931 [Acetivibrio clariflavus DSM 19732]|uniref:Uncharacterized protein n=1 Tax=Acetivibrio clariflavus (strain DSM 19732 / NBRC 101661 / EBR45) TaxID=720554 RepID=G8LWI3_ACECE|nr:hypothetical protein Clocl_0931 [Acetivibrio clariflavus DSM 19732]
MNLEEKFMIKIIVIKIEILEKLAIDAVNDGLD